MYYTEFTNFIT